MHRLTYRALLTLSSLLLFLYALMKYQPGFPSERSVEALVGGVACFWLVYLIGTIILAVVYALACLARGVPVARIGLKDERDRVVERHAYGAGFWVMFLGSFAAILGAGSGRADALAVLILTQVGAIGVILLIGVWDELRLVMLSRAAD